jgi:mannose-6-phosphate isomerase class I
MTYDPEPSYPLVGGEIGHGLPPAPHGILAIDGPAALPWDALEERLAGDVRRTRRRDRAVEPAIPGDPVFARLYEDTIAGLVDLPQLDGGDAIVLGPGAALAEHDALWYVDMPKRDQPDDPRTLFVDRPAQERHLRAIAGRLDAYVDLTDPDTPRFVDGDALRATLAHIATGPFRTRPTFLPGPWGGQWLRRRLRIHTEAANLAWSYELIAPEASVLLRDAGGNRIEVTFDLLLAEQADAVLGPEVKARFGGELPIRFDFLDTLEGGHLSIQCHPSNEYMRSVFGGTYTQDETYYVVETTPGASIFHGWRDGADAGAFEQAARDALDGTPFEPERFLESRRAEKHRLYLIPGGTPHASGAGNVVLEISATPYLYTLRFYDWLRRNLDGRLRPVHLEHAFANLDPRVRTDLVPEPRAVRAGEVVLGTLPELFFAVHRLDFDDTIEDDTADRFHLLNLVEGKTVAIETESGRRHDLSYAETIVVPASTGRHRFVNTGGGSCKLVKAFVK